MGKVFTHFGEEVCLECMPCARARRRQTSGIRKTHWGNGYPMRPRGIQRKGEDNINMLMSLGNMSPHVKFAPNSDQAMANVQS